MCDYSLADLPNRLAMEGEELTAHRFPTGSIGLASPADLQAGQRKNMLRNGNWWTRLKALFEIGQACPVPAVCIPPGARLVLRNIPADLQREWKVQAEEDVVFLQTSAAVNTYRDAIEFKNGRRVRLQDLRLGLKMDVLSLNPVAAEEPTITPVRERTL